MSGIDRIEARWEKNFDALDAGRLTTSSAWGQTTQDVRLLLAVVKAARRVGDFFGAETDCAFRDEDDNVDPERGLLAALAVLEESAA